MNKLRERVLSEICGLTSNEDKLGYDATHPRIPGSRVELKWIGLGKTGVNTKTPLTIDNIQILRDCYMVVGEESKHTDEYKFVPEAHRIWIIHPAQLETEFAKLEAKMQRKDDLRTEVMEILKDHPNFPAPKLKELGDVLKMGSSLINPKIPLKLFRERGLEITLTDPEYSRHLIYQYMIDNPLSPVTVTAKKDYSIADTFFTFT